MFTHAHCVPKRVGCPCIILIHDGPHIWFTFALNEQMIIVCPHCVGLHIPTM